jgi:metal-responsive CopG/Arc/MetJ family transcriptional regulator
LTEATLTLPSELLAEADRLVEAGKAESRNEIVADALRAELAARRRGEIDEDFAAMAHDREHQAEAERVMKEFGSSDSQTLREAE